MVMVIMNEIGVIFKGYKCRGVRAFTAKKTGMRFHDDGGFGSREGWRRWCCSGSDARRWQFGTYMRGTMSYEVENEENIRAKEHIDLQHFFLWSFLWLSFCFCDRSGRRQTEQVVDGGAVVVLRWLCWVVLSGRQWLEVDGGERSDTMDRISRWLWVIKIHRGGSGCSAAVAG
ncbi:hypothetical protein L2E82_22940 [Cichorium intybus]|uniref:Uncharacterized protein n=1 Tax=Cichorium intybus TaxID=13427 RepID=A0ACB9DYY1_CICIN|nr:hypothetical protein L2E82_22940 [Cichorium intybus]